MMLHYDKFETWERSFGDLVVRLLGEEAVNNLESTCFEYIEHAGDFVVNRSDIETVSTEIQCWLRAREFVSSMGLDCCPKKFSL